MFLIHIFFGERYWDRNFTSQKFETEISPRKKFPMMNDTIYALMQQGYSKEDATEIFYEICEEIIDADEPEEILADYGLEPDYLFDVI